MKAVLGCLLCLVLGTAQTFALKGGPIFPGGQVRTTGVYAGVMTPGPLSPGANSFGLFSITIPNAGTGTGVVVIFQGGQTYRGTVTGNADPDSAKLQAQVSATFSYQAQVLSSVETTTDPSGKVTVKESYSTQTFAATAAGDIDAQIRANRNVFSAASARLVGDADVQFSLTILNPFTQIGYIVTGYKQSDL
jgi:hypothetical protein